MALQLLDIVIEIRDDVKGLRGEVHGIATKVITLETKMDGLDELDHEKRLRTLENGKAWILGWAAGAGAVAAIIVAAVLKMVGK
jgi:hypothetical protein